MSGGCGDNETKFNRFVFQTELFNKFRQSLHNDGSTGVLIFPSTNSFIDYNAEFLSKVEKELNRKKPMVECGLDEYTAVEKFAMDILAHAD
jgi:hypothetical protein